MVASRGTEVRPENVGFQDLTPRAQWPAGSCKPVRLDPGTIRSALSGRRVLVTGAGGSIGSEICRQVAAVEPALLVLLDRHEGGLFEIAAELAEAHQDEAVLNNVVGTRQLARIIRELPPHPHPGPLPPEGEGGHEPFPRPKGERAG